MCQCEDCIGGNREVKFGIADTHFVIVVYGQTHHLQPVMVGKEGLALFKWVLRRHNKPYFFQRGMGEHGVGNDQMSDVDGIERTKKKTYLSQLRYLGCQIFNSIYIC